MNRLAPIRVAVALTAEDIEQIIEGIEHFIVGNDEDLELIWQPYIDKLNALREEVVRARS